jgi:hypothetical protein
MPACNECTAPCFCPARLILTELLQMPLNPHAQRGTLTGWRSPVSPKAPPLYFPVASGWARGRGATLPTAAWQRLGAPMAAPLAKISEGFRRDA